MRPLPDTRNTEHDSQRPRRIQPVDPAAACPPLPGYRALTICGTRDSADFATQQLPCPRARGNRRESRRYWVHSETCRLIISTYGRAGRAPLWRRRLAGDHTDAAGDRARQALGPKSAGKASNRNVPANPARHGAIRSVEQQEADHVTSRCSSTSNRLTTEGGHHLLNQKAESLRGRRRPWARSRQHSSGQNRATDGARSIRGDVPSPISGLS